MDREKNVDPLVAMQQELCDMEYNDALDLINRNDTIGTFERMKETGYLKKRLIV